MAKTVEEILGISEEIYIEGFSEEQEIFKKRFPAGQRVLFHSLDGSWSNLNSMTGTVWRVTKDPVYSHVIEVDYPVLLPAGLEVLEKNRVPQYAIDWAKEHECPLDSALWEKPWERMAVVNGSALTELNDSLDESVRARLNHGRGEVMTDGQLQMRKLARLFEWFSIFESTKDDPVV